MNAQLVRRVAQKHAQHHVALAADLGSSISATVSSNKFRETSAHLREAQCARILKREVGVFRAAQYLRGCHWPLKMTHQLLCLSPKLVAKIIF